MARRISLIVLIFSGLMYSCRKEDQPVVKMGYDYFPIEVGRFITYEVTEINIDQAVSVNDTVTYQLKEKIESQFIDNQGRPSLRIERYSRLNDTLPWVIKDVWYATRTASIAEKVEENERYIKLAFPVKEDQSWNGNNFNILPAWEYTYSDIGVAKTIASLNFEKTVTVQQRNNVNFIEFEKAWEIYAEGIGLIKKQFVDLDLNNGDTTNIRLGIILYQEIRTYGME